MGRGAVATVDFKFPIAEATLIPVNFKSPVEKEQS